MSIKGITTVFIASLLAGACLRSQDAARQKISFDAGWRFYQGDIRNAEAPDLADDEWRLLDLPHDWSIEGTYDTVHGTDWQSGYLPAGIGWYRKTFEWDTRWTGKKVWIEFDGVYMNSDVWVNGHHLGNRPYGYISFYYDITPFLRKGNNVLAVKVDHAKPRSGRWYTGSGIYRHVWLHVAHPLRVAHWGTFITTPEVNKDSATVTIATRIVNESETDQAISLETRIVDDDGTVWSANTVNESVAKGSDIQLQQQFHISEPALWSPQKPRLYRAVNIIRQDGKTIDTYETRFGIRELEFSAREGFKLNGEATKLKGVCLHHDAGLVGAAVPEAVLYRRLKLLKDMGCNAIRTAHNPFSPEFYSMCDTMGIMVLNEIFDGWEVPKASDDYGNYFDKWWKQDATDFLLRDRNHPSVVIWSIGNEVRKPTAATQEKLAALFHSLDPTRPITQGGKSPSREDEEEISDFLDIKGFNGSGERPGVFEAYHRAHPQHPIVATEVPHTYQTRGVYRTQTHWRNRDFPAPWTVRAGNGGQMEDEGIFPVPDLAKEEVFREEKQNMYRIHGEARPIANDAPWAETLYYQSSYDNATVRSSARKAWQRVKALDYVMGHFRWTGIDYLGETNQWPSRMANFGVIDICGFPKDHYYLYKSLWTEEPMVHLLPHWSHAGKEGVKIPVVAYTNCDEVELFLNGKSLSTQRHEGEQLVWMVPFEPGTLRAVARTGSSQVATAEVKTAGKPAGLQIIADKLQLANHPGDVVHLEVQVVDAHGVLVPMADNMVHFKVSGPGKLIGVDNGDPLDLSAYVSNERQAFRGKCLAIVRATGNTGVIKVSVESPGLAKQVLEIPVSAARDF